MNNLFNSLFKSQVLELRVTFGPNSEILYVSKYPR